MFKKKKLKGFFTLVLTFLMVFSSINITEFKKVYAENTKETQVKEQGKDEIFSEKLNIILPKETINSFPCEIKVTDSEGNPVKDAEIAYGLFDTWVDDENFDIHLKGKTDEFGKAIIKVENNNATCTMYFKARKGKVKSEIKTLKLLKEDYVIKTEEKDLLMGQGEKHIFNAIINDKNSDEIKEELIWESLNSEVATVDQNGQVTALKVGESIIKASIKKDPKYCIEIKVKVLKDVVKTVLRVELESDMDFYKEIRIPGRETNLETVLNYPVYSPGKKYYSPEFDENGKLLQLSRRKKGKPHFSVIANGKVIENPRDLIIKTGDNIICSQNGATEELQIELPEKCIAGEPFEIIAKDSKGKAVEGALISTVRDEYTVTDKEGKGRITLNEAFQYSFYVEKEGYIRSQEKSILVVLPKILATFPENIISSEEFNLNITIDGKRAPGIKVYWNPYDISYWNQLKEDYLIGETGENGNIKGKITSKEGKFPIYINYHKNLINIGYVNLLGKDIEKPEIIVKGIENNSVVSRKDIVFNVLVKDNIDEVIIPEVKCNGSILSKDKDNYSASLKEGKNTIEIIAKDKAGNSDKKEYTLIYKSNILVHKIVVKGSKEKLHPKDKITLKARAVDKENYLILDKEIIFTSSNEKVVKVDSKTGEVTAIGNGTVTLTAILKDNVSIKESVDITVTDEYVAYIRIEGYNHTILERRKIKIATKDMCNLGLDGNFERPTHAHTLLKTLIDNGFEKRKEGKEGKGKYFFKEPFYMVDIDGDKEFDQGRFSGWIYRVNGAMPNVGAAGKYLEDGDEITWFYAAFGFKNKYSEIHVDKNQVKVNENILLTASGVETSIEDYKEIKSPLCDAKVLVTKMVQGKEEEYNGLLEIKTDKKGKAILNFKEAGKYKISLIRYASDNTTNGEKIDIVRPIPLYIEVLDKEIPKESQIALENLNSKENIKRGSSAELKFNIKNNYKEEKEVTLAIVLYDDNTKEMINYSYIKKILKAGESEEFEGGFVIPQKGKYTIKAIVCDDLTTEKMNVLANPIVLKLD
ncbi:DUF4430 domain-containing protein [Clostridium rectalis]|uniref:DUF4430 domain-containing protein n=1 Tax=Clostridium rectalis TaxID=2040295 RepID=UPI000F62F578|nr:DUF4430 domain-containing protein [Clostridium rectalis]